METRPPTFEPVPLILKKRRIRSRKRKDMNLDIKNALSSDQEERTMPQKNKGMSKSNINFYGSHVAEQMASEQSARLVTEANNPNQSEFQTRSSVDGITESNETSIKQSASVILPQRKSVESNRKKSSKFNQQLSVLTANRYSNADWTYINNQQRTSLNMINSKSLERHEQILRNHAKSVYKDKLLKLKKDH